MNHIYRLIWSELLNTWIAVAESASGRGKGSIRKLVALSLSLCAATGHAAPVGATLVSGTGSIAQSGATTTIHQSSQKLSLNWNSFNVAPQETVDFLQPSAAAIAVNRILDTNGTQILGQVTANGQVWLVNPNGILFGQGAQVNVGGLVATTLDVNDAAPDGNARTFSGNGTGSVLNHGTIKVANGGYVALLANTVSNQGAISARLGTVAFGAGSAATLTFSGNSLVRMQVDQSVLASLAGNGGLINADGGSVVMSAGAKNALLASVVNNTGVIEARTVENREGVIILLGGMTAGTVNVGGRLDASAPDGGNGGFIETSAGQVKVANDTRVTTAAPAGRYGTWLIDPQDYTVAAAGGDITGATLSANLGTTPVILESSGGGTAGSGNVNVNDAVAWSANTTLTLTASNNVSINASITASGDTAGLAIQPGTANGGEPASAMGVYSLNNGVSVTLSGANPSLSISGTPYTVINGLGAAGSTTGTDLQGMRGNLTRHYALGSDIDAGATSGWNAGAGFRPVGQWNSHFTGTLDGLGHSITGLTINSIVQGVGLFSYVGNGGTVRNVGLVGGSVTGNLYVGALVGFVDRGTVSNSYATVPVTGASTVGGLVGYNFGSISNSYASGAVTGTAANSYAGGLAGFTSGSSSSIRNSYATGTVTGNNVLGGLVGYASDLGTVQNSHYNIDAVAINGTSSHVTPYGLYAAQYLAWLGNGKALSIADYAATLPLSSGYYQIGTVQGLKDLLGFADNPAYKFRLGADLDLAAIPGWHIPYFAGVEFDGAGRTLDHLAINQPFNGRIGFIGMQSSASWLGNLGLTNASVTGSEYTGALVGEKYGTVSNSYTTGAVTGSQYIGGLVGINQSGTVTDSYSTAAVTGDIYIGGLAGLAYGDISNSHATGHVTGGSFAVGGLVGEHDGGVINNSYATGNVTGTDYGVGGLVGAMYGGAVSNSYAIGDASGGDNVGGLVGYQSNSDIGGKVATSYATGSVSGTGNVGGLVGNNDVGTVSDAYATGPVSGTGTNGGLVGNNGGTVSNGYATGLVSGAGTNAGLVGNNAGTISNSFWDHQTSGQPTTGIGAGSNVGATGRTTAEMVSMANFSSAGWDIASTGNAGRIWRIYEGSTTPWLTYFLRPLTVTANGDVKAYGGGAYSGGNGAVYSVASPIPALSGTLAYGGSSQSAVDAGSYAITPSGHYSVQQGYDVSYVAATLTIHPYAVSLTGSRAYDGSLDVAAGALTLGALANGETLALSGTGTVAGKDVGALKPLTLGTLALGNGTGLASNYTFTGGTHTADVTPVPLTVTANPDSKTFNAVAYSGGNGVAYSGFVNGETAAVLGGALAYGGTSQGAINAGSYAIAPGGLTSVNYTVGYVNGLLTITPAPIIVELAAITGVLTGPVDKVYDGTAVATLTPANYLLTGWMTGDGATVTKTAGTYDTANAGSGKTVSVVLTNGDYAPTGSSVLSNYTLPTSLTGKVGAITPAPLTVTASPDSKTFNAVAYSGGNGVAYSGFVNGETPSVLGGALSYGGSSQGAINAGSYAIAPGGLTSGNYTVAYVNGLLTITPAPLAALIGALTNHVDKVYDGTTVATLTPANYLLTGWMAGDGATVTRTVGTYDTPHTGSGKTVSVSLANGDYAPTGGSVLSNYTLPTSLTGKVGAITPAPLTVTASPDSKTFNAVAYSGGNGVAYSGFVNGETPSVLGGALSYGGSSQGAINAGSYAIAPGGLTSGNYSVGYVDGILTIVPVVQAPPPVIPPGPGPTAPGPGLAPSEPALTPSGRVLNASSQIQSELTAFNVLDQHQTLLLSPTIGGEANPYLKEVVVVGNKETRINIGGLGPVLRVVNGGVKLPGNLVMVNE
ncbi:MAG: two-partner secretion domain-containing protein [Ramlibacter sp.]